jgi:hypothetical protein
LGVTGGGIMYLIGSLFYPDFNSNPAKDSSLILYYNTAEMRTDTTINNDLCYVVKTNKTYHVTKEMADIANRRYDSLNHLLELPIEQRGGARKVPRPKYSSYKYFIRKSDYIILRFDHISYTNDGKTVKMRRTTMMNPKCNIVDFRKNLD